MEIIALQQYTDKYVSLYEGEIRDLEDRLANKLIAKNIVKPHGASTGNELPSVTADNEGNILKVVDGNWTASGDDSGSNVIILNAIYQYSQRDQEYTFLLAKDNMPCTYEDIKAMHESGAILMAQYYGVLSQIDVSQIEDNEYEFEIIVYCPPTSRKPSFWVNAFLSPDGYQLDSEREDSRNFVVNFTVASNQTTVTFDKTYNEITQAIEFGDYVYATIHTQNSGIVNIMKLLDYSKNSNIYGAEYIESVRFNYSAITGTNNDVMVNTDIYIYENNPNVATMNVNYFKLTSFDPFG